MLRMVLQLNVFSAIFPGKSPSRIFQEKKNKIYSILQSSFLNDTRTSRSHSISIKTEMSGGQQIFTKTAKYQGVVVAIKLVNKAFVAISPAVVQEINQVCFKNEYTYHYEISLEVHQSESDLNCFIVYLMMHLSIRYTCISAELLYVNTNQYLL